MAEVYFGGLTIGTVSVPILTAMTDAEVIDALGVDAIRAETGASGEAIKKWRQRGIPWRFRPQIQRLAITLRKRIPSNFLDQQVAA